MGYSVFYEGRAADVATANRFLASMRGLAVEKGLTTTHDDLSLVIDLRDEAESVDVRFDETLHFENAVRPSGANTPDDVELIIELFREALAHEPGIVFELSDEEGETFLSHGDVSVLEEFDAHQTGPEAALYRRLREARSGVCETIWYGKVRMTRGQVLEVREATRSRISDQAWSDFRKQITRLKGVIDATPMGDGHSFSLFCHGVLNTDDYKRIAIAASYLLDDTLEEEEERETSGYSGMAVYTNEIS